MFLHTWCTICRTRPDDLVNHRLECEGDLFPCRVCDISFQTRALRLVHEKECRRPDSSVTARNVRARLQKVNGVLVGGASIEQENQMDVSVDDQIAGGSNTEQENHTVTSGNRSRGRKTRGRRSRGRKTRGRWTHGRKFPKRLDTRAEVARAEVDPMTWAEVGYSGGRSHDMGGSLCICVTFTKDSFRVYRRPRQLSFFLTHLQA